MIVRNAEAQLEWFPDQRVPPPAAKDTNLALDFTAWKLGGDTELHAMSALLSYILKSFNWWLLLSLYLLQQPPEEGVTIN